MKYVALFLAGFDLFHFYLLKISNTNNKTVHGKINAVYVNKLKLAFFSVIITIVEYVSSREEIYP